MHFKNMAPRDWLRTFLRCAHAQNMEVCYWEKLKQKLVNNFYRISVIFRVRSAKAVKITDMDLIKRLGAIVGMFVLFLIIRTLVSPPKGNLEKVISSLH